MPYCREHQKIYGENCSLCIKQQDQRDGHRMEVERVLSALRGLTQGAAQYRDNGGGDTAGLTTAIEGALVALKRYEKPEPIAQSPRLSRDAVYQAVFERFPDETQENWDRFIAQHGSLKEYPAVVLSHFLEAH